MELSVDYKVIFNAEEDRLLVQGVSNNPCLYYPENASYKDKDMKRSAWREIAADLNRSMEDCKKRWRNIKDTYNRRKRKGTTDSSLNVRAQNWTLAKMLTFLDNTESIRSARTRNSYSSTEEDELEAQRQQQEQLQLQLQQQPQPQLVAARVQVIENNSQYNNSEQESFVVKKRKRDRDESPNGRRYVKIIANHQEMTKRSSIKEEDSVDLFFKSITVSVKKLPPTLLNEAKMKILQIVCDLENRNASDVHSDRIVIPKILYTEGGCASP